MKPANASKSRSQGYICHPHICLVQKLLRKQHSPRLRHGDRRSAKMLQKKPAEMTFSYTESVRQLLDADFIEDAFCYQSESSGNSVGSPSP